MNSSYDLRDDAGSPLNARVEIAPSGIVLHSRSGTDRNRDYRQALELILARFDQAQLSYEIYLDSQPAQRVPMSKRRLNFDAQAAVSERFNQIVRAMNAGSSSNGAWRRILIVTPGANEAELVTVLAGGKTEKSVERLQATQLRQVTSQHIHSAVARLLGGEDAPNFAPSRDYDVLTDDGVALAPKKVFGLALADALGMETYPGHFSAGWSQICFELLEEAGLWIVPKGNGSRRPRSSVAEPESKEVDFPLTEEERSWVEGNPKIVTHLRRERRAGLAKMKRAEFIAKYGRLFCEDCGLDPIEQYGDEAGHACIEVHHHRVHVADMKSGHTTTTDDLKCLCANCHRVLHRKLALGLTSTIE